MEFFCRNIREFRKRGRIYWIVMTGRLGIPFQLYLPVRVVGDLQAQKAFWKDVNDQRRISGDQLVAGVDVGKRVRPVAKIGKDERCMIQRWELDTLSRAIAEVLWIRNHCMSRRAWIDWFLKARPAFLGCAVLALVLWPLLGTQVIPMILALLVLFAFWASQETGKGKTVSMKDIRGQVESWGAEIYEETWEVYVSPGRIRRRIPQLEHSWNRSELGYLMETDTCYFFYTREQQLMFYLEKELLGDWMAQKLFVQDCQAGGARYQILQPDITMDIAPAGEKDTDKIYPIAKGAEKKRIRQHRKQDSQEDWRKFWAEQGKAGRALAGCR